MTHEVSLIVTICVYASSSRTNDVKRAILTFEMNNVINVLITSYQMIKSQSYLSA